MGTLRNGRVAPGMHLEDADRPLERGGGRSPQRPQKAWWHPAEEGEGEKDGGAGVAKIAVEPRSESSGAFRALLVFTFILLISPQSLYPPLAKFRIAWLTAAASVGLLLLDRIPRGRPLLAPGRETWAVMALVGWAILTVPFSYWPGGSLAMITDVYSKTLVIFWLLGLTVNTPQRLSRVAWALSLMAIPIAYVGVSNYMSGNFLGARRGATHRRIRRSVDGEPERLGSDAQFDHATRRRAVVCSPDGRRSAGSSRRGFYVYRRHRLHSLARRVPDDGRRVLLLCLETESSGQAGMAGCDRSSCSTLRPIVAPRLSLAHEYDHEHRGRRDRFGSRTDGSR